MMTSSVDVTLTNTSSRPVLKPIHAVLSINNPTGAVSVPGALGGSGTTPYGKYYIDLTSRIAAAQLESGAKVTFNLQFVRKSGVTFSYKVAPYGVLEELNRAPAVTISPISSVTLPGTASLNATVTDDGRVNPTPTLTWLKESGPGSVTFANPGSATTTASFSLSGDYVLRLDANDGVLTGTATVAVTVNKSTPTITWATPVPITYGALLSATQLNAAASVSGNFTYSPAAETELAVGLQTLNVDFTPADTTNYTSASASVDIMVNAPPALNKVPVANAGINQTMTLPGGQRSIDVHLDGSLSSDPDGTVSAYSWTGIPNPSPNSTFSPMVTLYPGTYRYSLVVTDDKGATSQPSSVTVTVNQQLGPPQLTVNPLSYSINQGQTVSFAVSATHPDGNVVTLSAMPFIKNATFAATPGASAAGTFTFSPDVTQSGVQIVTFTARDRLGMTDTKTVQITVNKVNHAPVISIAPTAIVVVGKVLSFSATATDSDGDILTLTASGLPPNALFIPSTGTITFAPGTAQAGQHTVTLLASDGKLSASGVTVITVNPAQTGGSEVPSELVLHVDPVESLSLQRTQRITGSVNAPGQPVIPPLKSVLITGMDPVTGEQGQTLTVSLTSASGNFATHFQTGASQATFGTGITVNSITISSATSATAHITVGSAAAEGARVVTVVTGNETAVSVIGFNVLKGRAALTGRLLDADTGQAISGGSVILAGTIRSTTTTGDGSFFFSDIPSGQQTLTVNAANHELITLPVNAQVGLTINLGDIKSRTTVFNPASTPSATFMSVLGRGAAELDIGNISKEDVKKIVVDAILLTGGTSAGVLDEYGNQLNTNIVGNGVISLKASGVDLVANRLIYGETTTLKDYLYGFPLFFKWKTEPTLLRALSALQDVVDQAWANPNDPRSALTMVLFSRGKTPLLNAPRLSPETPLNAVQAYLMTSTLFAWANNEIYYMNGSDQPSPEVVIGSRERVRTLLAYYEGDIKSDAGSPLFMADGETPPVAYASADQLNIDLSYAADNVKEVTVKLSGSGSRVTTTGATIKLYQWRRQTSTDPAPADGPDPDATVKFTSGARHTYLLTVTDTNDLRSSSTVTINISGNCDFTTRNDQSSYPWCSTFTKFLGDQALEKIDPVKAYVGDLVKNIGMSKTIAPLIDSTSLFQKSASKKIAGFFSGANSNLVQAVNAMADSGQLKALHAEGSAITGIMGNAKAFADFGANIVKDQLASFVGNVANALFGYIIDKLTAEIIDTSRPSPPSIRAELILQGNTAVSQQVKLTIAPSPDEVNDFKKASAYNGTVNALKTGMRKYSYLIYRQTTGKSGHDRITIIPGSQLSSETLPTGTLDDYIWTDTAPPPGTNIYTVKARVIRKDGPVPPTVDTTTQRMLTDYMFGIIPGGSIMGSTLWKSLDIAETLMRGLLLQDSDLSDPETLYVGAATQQLPTLDLAVDKKGGSTYLSIPQTSGIFKVVPSGIEKFVDAGFKTPFQAGLAVDSKGNLYADNKASDDSYGGRIFSFQAGTGTRQLAGSTTYYSQLLQYARPANVLTLAYGVDSQGEAIYIADAMDQSIKRLSLNTANPPDHNVGQLYAQSPDFFFDPTSKMAIDPFGNLFLTQGPKLMQVQSSPSGATTVTRVYPDEMLQSPFWWATGVDFDQAGNLYLADMQRGTITMLPPPFEDFMKKDESYRKRFTVMSGLMIPLALKLNADGRGFVTADSISIHQKNFGIAGRIWDQAAGAPLAGASLLVDGALTRVKTDADGFFSLPDINLPSGPKGVKLSVAAMDGRNQVIPNIHLNKFGHTALLEDLVFNPLTMPRLGPIPPSDTNMTVDPDPLPVETNPFQLTSSDLGKTQARHFVVPDRRIFMTNSTNPPPVPPNSSVSDTLNFAPLPLDKPTPPAPSAPSVVQPVVSIVSPANGMITRAGSVTVTGMVETSEAILTATLTINGVDQQVSLTKGVFTVAATLKDGINVIFARAGKVLIDTPNNISYFEGRSEAVKVSKGASVSESLDFTGVVFRADGTTYKPNVDMIVTLYGITDASARYRVIDSVSVRIDGLYQFHLENGSAATTGVKALFQQLGSGVSVPMKVVVSDPRS
jgi:hypothetical protein